MNERGGRRALVILAVALAGVCCLVAAARAGSRAVHDATRPPTAAERSTAAVVALAQRWRSEPAGQIFPATLSYTTTLLDSETAHRAGIAAGYQCAAALDPALAGQARRDHCRAALRASYADQLGGTIYTTGLLAFPTPAEARAFAQAVPTTRPPVSGLRALALPGTASALVTDASRQVSAVTQAGPYVLMTVAGYADGRAAAVTGQYDAAAFTAVGQLAGQILVPLNKPVTVNCASRQWSSC